MNACIKMIISTFSVFSTALSINVNAEGYDKDYISELSSLPTYKSALVPIKLYEPSDFSNDMIDCINIDGEIYNIGFEYEEKNNGWEYINKDYVSLTGSASLPVGSFKELREKKSFGVFVNEDGRNPSPLYRISDDIVIYANYHCKYDKNGELSSMTRTADRIGYGICYRIPTEFLYQNCWYKSDGFIYYIGSDCMPVTKNRTIDGVRYVFNKYGQCQKKYTGWTKSSLGRRYYKNGILLKNKWLKSKSGKYFYAGNDGYILTGWVEITRMPGGRYSYFDSNGVWDGEVYQNKRKNDL